MLTKKLFLFNGPPRSGKDSLSDKLVKELGSIVATKYSFAKRLKEEVHRAFGLNVPYDYFEDIKDTPSSLFSGRTPRETYITYAALTKEREGNNYFASAIARQILVEEPDYAVISDLGFKVELDTMLNVFGAERLILVRTHRPGYNFTNDSRSYLDNQAIKAIDLKGDNLDEKFSKLKSQAFIKQKIA